MNFFKLIFKRFVRLFKSKNKSILYPLQTSVPIIPDYSKGVLGIDILKCNLCGVCENVCPANCIRLEKSKNSIIIDYSHCLWCSECIVACPTNALQYRKVETIVANNLEYKYVYEITNVITKGN